LPIRVLPDEVASAIAAGEVVERPASVVKELVENAIDAGARRIEISVEGGGQRLIEVADDGAGIAAQDVELAVERHATSKLAVRDDLFDIRTLGFRGEALASIAAVSRFELISRARDEDVGRRLVVESSGGRQIHAEGAPPGTLVRVRDLFYNVPARRKFLKTEATERRRIQDLVVRYALTYPAIAFQLTIDGRPSLQTDGLGDRRAVLAELLGSEQAQQMIVLPEAEGPPSVAGYVGPPSLHRSNRGQLTFFVNGRWVQDGSLSAAVHQAYQGLLMVGRYPLAVLFIELPPAVVDVNVHPAKSEVRFQDPSGVFSLVQRVVRATLLREAPPPEFAWEPGWGGEPGTPGLAWAQRDLAELDAPDRSAGLLPAEPRNADMPLLRAVGQVGTAYLVAEGPDGLYLIDQHAAHERVLFERFMRAQREGKLESQRLLAPVVVELGAAAASVLEERLPLLAELGFEVEPFGPGSFQVRAIPSLLDRLSPERALHTVVEDFEEDETPLAAEAEALIAARVCKRAAVRAGTVLSLEEQRQLVRDLEACASPRTCPHGRPTMIHLSVESLERQFGRKG